MWWWFDAIVHYNSKDADEDSSRKVNKNLNTGKIKLNIIQPAGLQKHLSNNKIACI